MSYMNKIGITCVISLLSLPDSYAQMDLNPFPKNNQNDYHPDFKVWYTDEESVDKDLVSLSVLFDKLSSLKGKVAESSCNLLASLCLLDSIQIKYIRLSNYFDMLDALHRDDAARKRNEELISEVERNTVWFYRELSSIPQKYFQHFTKEQSELKHYHYFIQTRWREKKRIQSALIDESVSGWQYELYQTILKSSRFPDINSRYGELNVLKDRVRIETSSDSLLRREGYKKLHEVYAHHKSLYAFSLIHLAIAQNSSAKQKGFKDAAEQFYFDKFYSRKDIDNLFKKILDSVAIFKEYQAIRKDYLERQNRRKLSIWDVKFSGDFEQPFFTIDSATTIICKALSPLGKDFQAELRELLNPINGRMELGKLLNKRPGNFSRGFVGSQSILYATQFSGLYNDIRIMTHEGTHAVHRAMMNHNHVLPTYAVGPSYLFESFAILSEFLLSDYLVTNAATKEEKQFYLEKYFDWKGMAIFSIAQDAILEQSIHDGVVTGEITSASDLDSVNNLINQQFSIWPTAEFPEQNLRWITNSLFYEDPFYNINYVLGALVAMQLYDLYQNDSQAFQRKYETLLKNGFTDNPAPLLKRFMDIDIQDPQLIDKAMRQTRLKLAELRILYQN